MRELKAAEDRIKDLYAIHSLTLDIAARKEKEQRSSVVVQNCFTFIHDLIEERKLVENKTMVRISINRDQGFLKTLSSFEFFSQIQCSFEWAFESYPWRWFLNKNYIFIPFLHLRRVCLGEVRVKVARFALAQQHLLRHPYTKCISVYVG